MTTAPPTPEAALYAALAAAQSQMGHAIQTGKNSHFRSGYAPLPEVIDAVKPALNAHGIAVVQLLKTDIVDGRWHVTVTTRLCHEAGGTIETDLVIPVDKPGAHAIGSAGTYGRRYSLAALSCISDCPDDDGNGTYTGPPPGAQRRSSTPKPAKPTPQKGLTPKLLNEVREMVPGRFADALEALGIELDHFGAWAHAVGRGDPREWDGPRRLDAHRWPASPGPQHEWEPPRTRDRRPTDTARLRALGNAVVPQCAEVVGRWVVEMETARRQLSYRNQSTQRNP